MLEIQGRRFAAGLVWLERAGPLQVTRMARRYRRPRYLHWGAQTGYALAPADDGSRWRRPPPPRSPPPCCTASRTTSGWRCWSPTTAAAS